MDWLLHKIREIKSSGELILCYEAIAEIARMVLLLEDHHLIGMLDLTSGCIPRIFRQAFTFQTNWWCKYN